MKIVCLNILGGKFHKDLLNYLKSEDADIYCLQEVLSSSTKTVVEKGFHTDILSDIKDVLHGYNCYFSPMMNNFAITQRVDFDIEFGQAIFVRKNIRSGKHGVEVVHKGSEKLENLRIDAPRIMQYIEILGDHPFTLFNFHGIATWPKTDTEPRIVQSENVRRIMDQFHGRKILCGDFNLALKTKSMKILEHGMRNLIVDFGIQSTRPISMVYEERMSDYYLVTPDIKVRNFEVPEVLVSDHLPLVMEFD